MAACPCIWTLDLAHSNYFGCQSPFRIMQSYLTLSLIKITRNVTVILFRIVVTKHEVFLTHYNFISIKKPLKLLYKDNRQVIVSNYTTNLRSMEILVKYLVGFQNNWHS